MNRRTMLAPMRPRPIMPTCIAPPLAPQPLVEAPWTPRLLLHGDRALPYLRRPPASIAVSPAAQVQPRRADRQAVERDLREPARQLRVDVEPAPRRVGAEAEDRLQQVEDAPCGPRLWHVRLRIHDREGAGAALDAGVELRQPVAHEVARRLRDVARHAGRLGGEAVALEAERDDAVVVRPDGSPLVGEGIVRGVPRGQRPDAPAAPHVGLEETLHDPRGAIRAGDTAPQAMAGVGGDRPDGLLLWIERERVEPEVLAPEFRLERRTEGARLGTQPGRALRLGERIEDLRHAQPRVEDVALELAQRLRLPDLAAVGIDDRVDRVLPAHVLVALRGARPVLLEAVAVEVAGAVDPLEAAERRLPVLAKQRIVAQPLPRLVQDDQVERRGVGGAVVRRVRDQTEVGELAGAHLVRDLAGLGVARVVPLRRLQLGELPARAPRQVRVDDHALQARDERVAAEERDEPGHAGGGHPDVRAEVVVVQAERPQFLARLAVDAVDVLGGARNLRRYREPT